MNLVKIVHKRVREDSKLAFSLQAIVSSFSFAFSPFYSYLMNHFPTSSLLPRLVSASAYQLSKVYLPKGQGVLIFFPHTPRCCITEVTFSNPQ